MSETRAPFHYPIRLEAARFVFRILQSLWNLTDNSTAVQLRRLSNFKVMRWFKLPIPCLIGYWNGALVYTTHKQFISQRSPMGLGVLWSPEWAVRSRVGERCTLPAWMLTHSESSTSHFQIPWVNFFPQNIGEYESYVAFHYMCA